MQPPSKGVVLNMQPYSDSKEEEGGSKPRGGVLGPQILQVKDYVLWSLFNFAFWNCCCLGFAALVFSVKSRDRKVVGDVEGASNYGKKAKCLNIIAVIVSVLFLAIIIALVATGKLAFYHTEMHDLQHQNPSFDWNRYSGK